MRILWHMPEDFPALQAHVQAGGIFAYPTEGVFGLGCDPCNESAARHILRLKGDRPLSKGLIVLGGDFAQLAPFLAPLSAAQCAEFQKASSEFVTFIMPAAEHVPAYLSGAHTGEIAVRLCAWQPLIALCRALGHALISTSANLSGQAAARNRAEVEAYFSQAVATGDLPILDAPTGGAARASRIIRFSDGQRLR